MKSMSMSGDESREKLKSAAEFLLKGGTLLSEPCEKCSGIQIKKDSKVRCMICGNVTKEEHPKPNKTSTDPDIFSYRSPISDKIRKRLDELTMSIGSDNNLNAEEQRLRLINSYITILEKIKLLNQILRLSNDTCV